MKKDPSILFFTVGTMLFSYILWGIVILCQQLGWFPQGSNWFMPFYIIGGNAPPIVAYFTLKRADPSYTLKAYFKNAFALKSKPLYYLLTAVMVGIYFGVPALMGGISTETSPGLEGMGFSGHIPLYLTLIAIPFFFFGGGSEELGWRGVLQPGLEKKMHVIPATLITATIWALWHLPLWFMDGTGQAEVNFGLFFLMVIGFSFALTAIRRVSGSLWLCVLFHCAINSLQGTWPVIDNASNRIVTSIVYIVVAVVVLLWHERKTKAVQAEYVASPES